MLPKVVTGDCILTWAFTEQDPRYLPETVRLSAVADGDDFVLNGTKLFVENFVVADLCLVVCRTSDSGLSVFLVDAGTPASRTSR